MLTILLVLYILILLLIINKVDVVTYTYNL